MESTFWPWWIGAIALAGVGHLSCRLLQSPLGVSGYLGRLTRWSEELEALQEEQRLNENQAQIQQQLLEITLQEMADKVPAEELERLKQDYQASAPAPVTTGRLHIVACLTFALGILAGGLFSAVYYHRFQLSLTPPTEMEQIWGSSTLAAGVLFLGGILVGFGTVLGGGCTSGHGLTGCSRLRPGSLVATATFLGVAAFVAHQLVGGWRA